MALSDLAIFTDYAYTTLTEVLAQQVDLFNGASDGTITLATEAFGGDFSDKSFYTMLAGIVRRRNPYGDGAVAEKVLAQKIDSLVKIAAGTPPIRMDNAWYAWIKRDPAEPAVVLGIQMAKLVMADMINVAIGSVSTCLLKTPALINDISAKAGADSLPSPLALGNTSILLGDAMSEVQAWVMFSKSWNDLYGNALTNNERLFSYGTTNVTRDPMGRRYIMADNPNLMVAGAPAKFHTLGLTPGAVEITHNDDFHDNWSETNGNENIKRTYQAEWSYNVGVKGFSYDKAAGGHAPNDAALFSAGSWDQVATSIKNGPGVALVSQ